MCVGGPTRIFGWEDTNHNQLPGQREWEAVKSFKEM
jgi:hypothetical protein